MKLIKLHLLLVITALIFTLEFLAWQWIDGFTLPPTSGTQADVLMIWIEASLGIGAFAIIVALLAPAFSKFFLGYQSKKPDEGSEVYFYVVLTLFVLALALLAERHFEPERRDTEKDTQFLCELLNENLEFSSKDGTKQQVDDICGTDEPDAEEPEKSGKPSTKTRKE